ncbi:ABC transporter [Phytophthora megakarya]|uniref:ABC transporter n=1 Tax=Phytophthora megakarya TaxID=4795 RepID=A0A225WTW0_9STRA|nr:ABC transporter [Phytophthora megakarya]
MERCYYASWDAFFAALTEYQDATHQRFRKRTSRSVSTRNADLQKRRRRTATTKIPISFEKYYVRLCCTHGWRRRSSSTGKRKNYFVKSTECDAQLSITVVWVPDIGFQLNVTQQNTTHNHALGSSSYDNHPVNRGVDNTAVIDFVDELQVAGAKKELMLEYIRLKTGKRDVHNLVQNLKDARQGSTTVETRHEAILHNFSNCRNDNTATVIVDDDKLAQTIRFQQQQMRRLFTAFSEVLMNAATHNTNDVRYKIHDTRRFRARTCTPLCCS